MPTTPIKPSAVPIADKSAARKPLIVAIVTIVLLVGITLLLFFVNIKTAGHAIHIGNAAQVGQGGIFLTEASEQVGKLITLPIKANLGDTKSVSFQFALTLDDRFTYNGYSPSSLMNNLVVDGNNVAVIQELQCSDVSGVSTNGPAGCTKDTKTITVKMSWLCADDACSNALSGNDVILGELSLVGKTVGVGALTFSNFEVYELGTGNNIISDNGHNQNIELTAAGCSATNLAVCSQVECTVDNKWFWYGGACHLEKQVGCTTNDQCTKNAICTNNLCKLIDGAVCTGPSGVSSSLSCASSNCVNGLCVAPVCDATHLNICNSPSSCSTAMGAWYKTLGSETCVATCPIGTKVGPSIAADGTTYQACIATAAGADKCTKDNLAKCTTQDLCNNAGLLWTAPNTCSACPVQTTFDPATAGCIPTVITKIKIELLNPSNIVVASGVQVSSATKYTVKATITPGVDLPKDHLVLISVYYGSDQKTSFVDHKPEVAADGQEVIQFTHDIAPDFKGDLKVKAFVWNNWPLPTGAFDALIPEGGSETYTVQ